MAYVEVGLQHWAGITDTLGPPITDDFVIQASFASKAYTPGPIGGTATFDIDTFPTAALSTANVTPLAMESTSGNDLLDMVTATTTLTSFYMVMTAAALKQKIIDMAPYVYWPLDEGSGTTATDASGNGRDGTIDATASWIAPGTGVSYGVNAISTTTVNVPVVSRTMTVPCMSSTDGYTVIAAVRSSNLANNGPCVDFGGLTTTGYARTDTSGRWSFGTINSRPQSSGAVIVAGNWQLLVWYIREDNYAQLFANGMPAVGATGVTTVQSTADGASLRLLILNSGSGAAFQHVAFFNKQLTHDQIMSIAGADIIDITPVAAASSDPLVDFDIPAASLTLTTVTSTPALESTPNDLLDFVTADTVPCWGLTTSTDLLDIECSATGMFFTTFVGIDSSSDLLDFVTNDPILRRSVFTLAAQTTSTVTATVVAAGQMERISYLPAPETLTMELLTRASIIKVGRPIVPRTPESVSDTDPSQATGIVIKALMGVSVDMDTPTIVDGKPT